MSALPSRISELARRWKEYFLEDESTVTVKAIQDIPLGHKISLTSLARGRGGQKIR